MSDCKVNDDIARDFIGLDGATHVQRPLSVQAQSLVDATSEITSSQVACAQEHIRSRRIVVRISDIERNAALLRHI